MSDLKPSIAGRPKNIKKKMQILESAAEVFLNQGYERTSMDAVAKHSQVSKQTVYSHFKSKDALYSAVIESKCTAYQLEESSLCNAEIPLEDILRGFAIKFIQLLTDHHVVSMYNVVIGEAQQNAQIAKLFHDAGPVHSIELIQQLLQKHPQSQLSAGEAYATSVDFFNLLKGDYHMRSLLHLPYQLDEESTKALAERTAKTIGLIVRAHHEDL